MATRRGSGGIADGMGVILTDNFDKKNPVSGAFSKRFLVLTQESFHWFKREEGYDLFGEERGHISVAAISSVKLVDAKKGIFEVTSSTDKRKRYFRSIGDNDATAKAQLWVDAINNAIANVASHSHPKRRQTISNYRANSETSGDFPSPRPTLEPVVARMVSLQSVSTKSEVVIARNPDMEAVILVPNVQDGDTLFITTSNGGTANINALLLAQKLASGNADPFEVPVMAVLPPSSLLVSVLSDATAAAAAAGGGSTSGKKSSSPRDNRKYNITAPPSPSQREEGSSSSISSIFLSDRQNIITLSLTVAAALAGLLSFQFVSKESVGFFFCCLTLAVYCSYSAVQRARQEVGVVQSGKAYRIILHANAAAVSEAEQKAKDAEDAEEDEEDEDEAHDAIPKRFIDGCGGDMVEARRRWDITSKWRKEENVDGVLLQKQPHFQLIKKFYPHYHAGRGRLGHICFWERPGELEFDAILKAGATGEDMVSHWIFVTEWQWRVLAKGDETAKSIAVLDVKGTGIGDFFGARLDAIKKCVGYANQHYPERSYVVYIVNASWFFTSIWAIVKPWVHPNTQKKVRIVGCDPAVILNALKEHIDPANIPKFYGGELACGDGGKDSARFASPDVLALNEYVRKLNAGELDGLGPVSTKPVRLSVQTPTRGGATTDSAPAGVVSPLTPETTLSDWSVSNAPTVVPPVQKKSSKLATTKR